MKSKLNFLLMQLAGLLIIRQGLHKRMYENDNSTMSIIVMVIVLVIIIYAEIKISKK